MKFFIWKATCGSKIAGVEVYLKTALKPTPNLPIVAEVLFVLAMEVIALMSPSAPLAVSASSSAGSEMENFFVPLCLKINLSA